MDPAPDLRRGRSQHVRARRRRPSARQRRRRDHDGRGRRHRRRASTTTPPAPRRSTRPSSPVASRPARCGSRSRSPCSVSSSPAVIATKGPIDADDLHACTLDYGQDVLDAVAGVATDAAGPGRHDRAKAERNAATDAAAADGHRASCAGEGGAVRRPRARDQGSRPQPDQEGSCASASSTRACASTAVVRATCVRCQQRGRRAADGARHRPVPAWRDPGDERRHHGHAAHEPADGHAQPGDPQVLPVPLQHGPVGQR